MAISDIPSENTKTFSWLLFVAIAFPIHIWAYVILIRDISWVAQRTNFRDALGFLGYGLSFTFLESALLWLFLGSIGALFLKKSDPGKRLAHLSLLGWILLAGAMLINLKNTEILPTPESLIPSLEKNPHGDWLFLGGLAAVLIPVYIFFLKFSLNSKKARLVYKKILHRISPLMGLYLAFDLLGLMLVLTRNIKP